MNFRVLVHSGRPSRSSRALARGLGALRIRTRNSRYRPRLGDTLINWGSSSLPIDHLLDPVSPSYNPFLVGYYNCPRAVSKAINKLECFEELKHNLLPTVPYTTEREVAEQWLEQGNIVYARTLLSASAGRGLIVVKRGEELPDAPLYTRYVGKNTEYRVHVVLNDVIDFAQKKKRRGSDASPLVRSYDRGWIFARQDVSLPETVEEVCWDAVINGLGLDFGAVDVVQTEDGEVHILEINTAPGLEGTTLQSYVDAFRRSIHG